jgi:hypothetical protein
MRRWIIAVILTAAGASMACGGSSAAPDATPSVGSAHPYPYPQAAVARFVRTPELQAVSMPIRMCVVGRFEDEMPYSQFASLEGTGALIDRTIQFAAGCASGG